MGIQTIGFSSIHFHYPNQSQTLFEDIDLTFGVGWTAVLGANGAGKSTLLKLATGELRPTSGQITRPESVWYLEQRTDEPPQNYDEFAFAYDREACRLHGSLRVERDWLSRWESLSHGERKRAQLAHALWKEPEVLAVDEPTNHLDTAAVELVANALASFRGIGIIVSHDRTLAESLCEKTVIVHAPYIRMLDCKPSVALHEASRAATATYQMMDTQRQQLSRLSEDLIRRSSKASIQDRLRSKRHIPKKDHDAKAKIDCARVSGADGKAGRLKSQLEKRIGRDQQRVDTLHNQLVIARSLDIQGPVDGITITSAPLKRNTLIRFPEGSFPMGPERMLHHGVLEIGPMDRIAVTGLNGSGKSTLMRHLFEQLSDQDLPVAYVPQEQDRSSCETCLQKLDSLDSATKGRVISSLARLGTDLHLIRSSALASPGEAKKLLLSMLFENPISILLLDEPTNHMDLPSRMALEQALATYEGALVCISHDHTFIERLCTIRWHIESDWITILS